MYVALIACVQPFVMQDDQTALMQAAFTGYVKIVDMLLKRGANVNSVTTVIWTAGPGYVFSVWGSVLTFSVYTRVKSMLELLQDICHVVYSILFMELLRTICIQHGNTALIFASRGGHPGIVQLLLEHGANKEQQDKVQTQHE